MTTEKTIDFLIENEKFEMDFKRDIQNSADIECRDEFECTEPIHLWEAYCIGDGDEDILNDLAKEHGCSDYEELLGEMDTRFQEIIEEKYEQAISELDIAFEFHSEGRTKIYGTSMDKIKSEFSEENTEIKEIYSSFPDLFCAEIETI